MQLTNLNPNNENAIAALIEQKVQEEVQNAIANIPIPIKAGDTFFCLNKLLPNGFIVDRGDGWPWLRLDLFSGTIGSANSTADLKDDRLSKLFLAWEGTTEQWTNGDAIALPDSRGRVFAIANKGEGLSNREIGETIGEEKHLPTLAETIPHNHGGGNHTHVTYRPGGGGWGWYPAQRGGSSGNIGYSGNIIQSQGGGMPFNVIQPTTYLAAIAFLGVKI